MYTERMEDYSARKRVKTYTIGRTLLIALLKHQADRTQQPVSESAIRLNEQTELLQKNMTRMKCQLMSNPLTKDLMDKLSLNF